MAKQGVSGKITFGRRRKGKAHKSSNKHSRKTKRTRGQG